MMPRMSIFALRVAVVLFANGSAAGQKAPAHENPHKVLEWSCEKCHVATSFRDIRFDHGETGFDLTGSHAEVSCLDCHSVENFSKVEANCATCHQDVHRGRFGITCERCHDERGWTVFDTERIHEATDFPIQGPHLLVDCESCHPSMPTADLRQAWKQCFDCHEKDYLAAINPEHKGSEFSTVCQSCHEMTAWRPAIMGDHDAFFPIYSGTHNRKWDSCSNCHVVSGNYQLFECITCHEHRQVEMDGKHLGIPGYAYNSPACYQCHPTGEAGDFREHDTLFFPVYSGAHAGEWNDCSVCHYNPSSRKDFTCVSCHEHDQAQMDDKHLGEVPDYLYDSAECYRCHPNGRAEDDRR